MKTAFRAKIIFEGLKDDPDFSIYSMRSIAELIFSGKAIIAEVVTDPLTNNQEPVLIFKEVIKE